MLDNMNTKYSWCIIRFVPEDMYVCGKDTLKRTSMKETITILAMLLFLLAGCGGSKQSAEDFITVDVTKSYPKKELILQDFMDVEYIPLETSDDFLCQGFLQDVGENIIVVKNFRNTGDLFIFDRKGKAIKNINHQGQGAGEYVFPSEITLDEGSGEIFVCDFKKILVYDLDGNYKRSFNFKEGAQYSVVKNFDRENLICYDNFVSNDGEANEQAFMLVSKRDGSIAKDISLPFKDKKITAVISKDPASGMTYGATPNSDYPLIPHFDNWVLFEASSDTLFSFLPDCSIKPFIVRTPSIQSMNPEIFLFLSVITDRYYFMEIVEKKYDFGTQDGYPRTNIMYDKQEKATFKYTVYNGDYSNKKQVYMNSIPVNSEIATRHILPANELVEAYEKGQLKGRLKEIAAELNEESNPVIMLVKHKKD